MKIGLIIQKLRTDANMTQEELAERLFVTRQLVSAWENSLRRPDYSTVQKIAGIFNVAPETIIDSGKAILKELNICIDDSENIDIEVFSNKLNSFLKTLSDIDCKIFVRRYYLFEATKEIADTLGIRDGTVRTSLFRTRNKLKNYLMEENCDE